MKYSCSLAQSSCQILPKKRLHHLSLAQIRIQSVPVVSRRGEASLWEVEAGDYHIYPYSLIIYREAQAKVAERSVKVTKRSSKPQHLPRAYIKDIILLN